MYILAASAVTLARTHLSWILQCANEEELQSWTTACENARKVTKAHTGSNRPSILKSTRPADIATTICPAHSKHGGQRAPLAQFHLILTSTAANEISRDQPAESTSSSVANVVDLSKVSQRPPKRTLLDFCDDFLPSLSDRTTPSRSVTCAAATSPEPSPTPSPPFHSRQFGSSLLRDPGSPPSSHQEGSPRSVRRHSVSLHTDTYQPKSTDLQSPSRSPTRTIANSSLLFPGTSATPTASISPALFTLSTARLPPAPLFPTPPIPRFPAAAPPRSPCSRPARSSLLYPPEDSSGVQSTDISGPDTTSLSPSTTSLSISDTAGTGDGNQTDRAVPADLPDLIPLTSINTASTSSTSTTTSNGATSNETDGDKGDPKNLARRNSVKAGAAGLTKKSGSGSTTPLTVPELVRQMCGLAALEGVDVGTARKHEKDCRQAGLLCHLYVTSSEELLMQLELLYRDTYAASPADTASLSAIVSCMQEWIRQFPSDFIKLPMRLRLGSVLLEFEANASKLKKAFPQRAASLDALVEALKSTLEMSGRAHAELRPLTYRAQQQLVEIERQFNDTQQKSTSLRARSASLPASAMPLLPSSKNELIRVRPSEPSEPVSKSTSNSVLSSTNVSHSVGTNTASDNSTSHSSRSSSTHIVFHRSASRTPPNQFSHSSSFAFSSLARNGTATELNSASSASDDGSSSAAHHLAPRMKRSTSLMVLPSSRNGNSPVSPTSMRGRFDSFLTSRAVAGMDSTTRITPLQSVVEETSYDGTELRRRSASLTPTSGRGATANSTSSRSSHPSRASRSSASNKRRGHSRARSNPVEALGLFVRPPSALSLTSPVSVRSSSPSSVGLSEPTTPSETPSRFSTGEISSNVVRPRPMQGVSGNGVQGEHTGRATFDEAQTSGNTHSNERGKGDTEVDGDWSGWSDSSSFDGSSADEGDEGDYSTDDYESGSDWEYDSSSSEGHDDASGVEDDGENNEGKGGAIEDGFHGKQAVGVAQITSSSTSTASLSPATPSCGQESQKGSSKLSTKAHASLSPSAPSSSHFSIPPSVTPTSTITSSAPTKRKSVILENVLRFVKAVRNPKHATGAHALSQVHMPSQADHILHKLPRLKICQALTLLDMTCLKSIRPREFTNKEWTRKETAGELAPNLTKMVEHYNSRSYWVASQILLRVRGSARRKCMEAFISIAYHAWKLRNFYCLFAVMAGLSLTPVFRLQRDWKRIKAKAKAKFEKLKEVVTDSSRNFKAYREQFKLQPSSPRIPHLAVTLKDCFNLEELPTWQEVDDEGAAEGTQRKINMHKLLSLHAIVREVLDCQQREYEFDQDAQMLALMGRLLKAMSATSEENGMLTMDQMYARSKLYYSKVQPTPPLLSFLIHTDTCAHTQTLHLCTSSFASFDFIMDTAWMVRTQKCRHSSAHGKPSAYTQQKKTS